MRNILRKWLGITDQEPEKITDHKLRLMIGQAFESALSGGEDHDWGPIHIPSTLERALQNASRETAGSVAQSWIEARINNEKFIDEVVDRIKRKQV